MTGQICLAYASDFTEVRLGALVLVLSLALQGCSGGNTNRSPEPGAIVAASHAAVPTDAVTPNRLVAGFGNIPIRFERNVGQAPPQTGYVARGNGYTAAITERGVTLTLRQAKGAKSSAMLAQRPLASLPTARLSLSPVHANASPQLRAERPQSSISNYFVGNDPSKWHSNIANYAAVRYEQLYPGIDWVIYGNSQQLEYDFVVAPGADPRRIRLQIDGADSLSVDEGGDLLIKKQNRILRQLKPAIYQTAADGTRHNIDGHYVLATGQFAFALGNYDHRRALIIDPVVVYSTYLGGSAINQVGGSVFNQASAIAADGEGNAYVVGSTNSTDFPMAQPLQSSNLEKSFVTAFIAKFNAGGTALVYSTYLGGTGSDTTGNLGFCGPANAPNPVRGADPGNGGDGATAIAVDAAGNVYVTGFTSSTDFPTVDPLQAANHAAVNHGSNAFLAKLNAAGNALVYSTYLGGSGIQGAPVTGDMATAVAVDGSGAAYVTGITMSADFPTLMPIQQTNKEVSGRPTAFVAKLNATGSALVYSSYLGGSGGNSDAGVGDCANAIAVDGEGNAYVVGQTSSANFPTAPAAAAFQSVNPSLGSTVEYEHGSAFVSKLNSSGSALVYSTYLGGSTSDAALAVSVDARGEAYLSGYTLSTDFPIANALQPQNATGGRGANAFVTKFNPTGSELIYSTYLGGSTFEQANALALDAAGNAYVAGTTYSSNFPIVEPLQATNNASSHNLNNAFISVLNASGSTLEFSTYLGGSGRDVYPPQPCPIDGVDPCGPGGDSAAAIAVDSSGNLYVTGFANSTDFPMAAAFETTPTGMFVTKIVVGSNPPIEPGGDPPPPTVSGGGGALGWGAISILGFAVAMRCRKRREQPNRENDPSPEEISSFGISNEAPF
jgi:hypothetical protein